VDASQEMLDFSEHWLNEGCSSKVSLSGFCNRSNAEEHTQKDATSSPPQKTEEPDNTTNRN